MAKIAAKNATILINGSKFSTYTTAYETTHTVDPLDATGFSDGSRNFIPGILTGKISADMLWDATADTGIHAKLKTSGQTGHVTIIPEVYAVGVPAISLPFVQATYNPGAAVTDILKIGTLEFESYGDNNGVEIGNTLYQATITNTATSTTFDNGAASSVKYSGIVHVWTPTSADTYAVKIEHSTNDSTWADLATFTISGNGQSIVSARVTGTGTVNRYRRITATRTGAAANPFGFTVVLYTA